MHSVLKAFLLIKNRQHVETTELSLLYDQVYLLYASLRDFNCLLHSNSLNELAVLTLQESYSLSVLMYSIPAMSLSAKQISELGVCWNSVIRKLFITTTNGNLLKVFCMV